MERLTLFQEDSLANHLVLPGSKKAQQMTVTSGKKCLELSKRSDQLGLLAKTLLESSNWLSTKCYLTWKIVATPQKRSLYRLAVSVRRIGEIESGLLRTPAVNEPGVTVGRLVTKEGTPAKVGERAYDKHTGRCAQVGLIQLVQMMHTPTSTANQTAPSMIERSNFLRTPDTRMDRGVMSKEKLRKRIEQKLPMNLNFQLAGIRSGLIPTPQASDATMGAIMGKKDQFKMTKGLPRKINQNGHNGSIGLARLMSLLPTPRASDCNSPGHHGMGGMDLRTALTKNLLPTPQSTDWKQRGNLNDKCVQNRIKKKKQVMLSMSFMATPTASDGKGSGQNSTKRDRLDYQIEKTQDGERLNGQLNPHFVEQMMGFPVGWTDLKVLEMP